MAETTKFHRVEIDEKVEESLASYFTHTNQQVMRSERKAMGLRQGEIAPRAPSEYPKAVYSKDYFTDPANGFRTVASPMEEKDLSEGWFLSPVDAKAAADEKKQTAVKK